LPASFARGPHILTAMLEGRTPNAATRFFQVFSLNPLMIYLFSELFVTVLGMIEVAPGVGLHQWVGIHVFQVPTRARWARCCARSPTCWSADCWATSWIAAVSS